jgi:hypothetical protein
MNKNKNAILLLAAFTYLSTIAAQECVTYRNSLSCNGVTIEASYKAKPGPYLKDSVRIDFVISNNRENSILIFDPSVYLNEEEIIYPAFPGFSYDLGSGWSVEYGYSQILYLVEVEPESKHTFCAKFPWELLLTRGYTSTEEIEKFIKLGHIRFSFGFGYLEVSRDIEFITEGSLNPLAVSDIGLGDYFNIHLERMELEIIHARSSNDLNEIKQ